MHFRFESATVEKALPKGYSTLDWTMQGCRTVQDIYHTRNGFPDYSCGRFVASRFEAIKKYPESILIILNRFTALLHGPNEPHLVERAKAPEQFLNQIYNERNKVYHAEMLQGFYDTLCKFSETNLVYVVKNIPELLVNVPKTMARNLVVKNELARVKVTRASHDSRVIEFDQTLERASKECGIHILDLTDTLCDEEFCYGDRGGVPMYYDDDHLSEFGASHLIPSIRSIW